jgi:hypothetical protein
MEALDRLPYVQGMGGEMRVSNELGRLDMSEFMEEHSVAREIVAPRGYAESGHLTAAVRRQPSRRWFSTRWRRTSCSRSDQVGPDGI